jgi:hypothetical protein
MVTPQLDAKNRPGFDWPELVRATSRVRRHDHLVFRALHLAHPSELVSELQRIDHFGRRGDRRTERRVPRDGSGHERVL